MEKEYIECEALVKLIEKKCATLKLFRSLRQSHFVEALEKLAEEIKKIPATDVVEVVRCKDCKYYLPNYCRRVPSSLRYMEANDFCSYGAKMDGKGDKQ